MKFRIKPVLSRFRHPLLIVLATVFALATASSSFHAQTATSAPTIPPLPNFGGRDELILRHLNSIITWYHEVGNQLPTVGLPTDAIYEGNARTLAVQAVQAAFQSAASDATLVTQSNSGTPAAD